jgi:hypothetical protein
MSWQSFGVSWVMGATVLAAVGAVVACGDSFSDCKAIHTCAAAAGQGATDDAGGAATTMSGGGSAANAGTSGHGGMSVNTSGGSNGSNLAGSDNAPAGAGGVSETGCHSAEDCSNGDPKDGEEVCDPSGICLPGTPPDTTPPSVVSFTPAANAKGVFGDAVIVVTFSEPMNKASAQASFQSTDLAGKVTFAWNTDGTVMTVTPTEGLDYATGLHSKLASVAAKVYSVTLNTSAADLAGNTLATNYVTKFSTLRRITLELQANSYELDSSGDVALTPGIIVVGDYDDNSWARMLCEFDLSALPAEAVALASGELALPMTVEAPASGPSLGSPFSDLGALTVDHIYVASLDAQTLQSAPLASLGTLTTMATSGVKTLDVSSAVFNDAIYRVERKNHAQFRVQFAKNTDNDGANDAVLFNNGAHSVLNVDYMIP